MERPVERPGVDPARGDLHGGRETGGLGLRRVTGGRTTAAPAEGLVSS
ncbi:hypothetical protein [Nonomuraea rubra]|uniref:Uncharacterized protein n=1 Tax=Nonomuraea rubra TaxID=46180 RepID=A0A7X0NTL5_9ACTN|nr:hypothetical protein [Nonomuraea rubra]MBB6549386.1 hypothetical protein [Nonomuraea rubra]